MEHQGKVTTGKGIGYQGKVCSGALGKGIGNQERCGTLGKGIRHQAKVRKRMGRQVTALYQWIYHRQGLM